MRKLFFMFIGGFCGAVIRSLFYNIDLKYFIYGFPTSTVIVNLAGCFLLSFISNLVIDNINMDEDLYIALTTGMIGAFTTFSTFSKDFILLMVNRKFSFALLYMLISLAGGFFAVYLGYMSAGKIADRLIRKEDMQN